MDFSNDGKRGALSVPKCLHSLTPFILLSLRRKKLAAYSVWAYLDVTSSLPIYSLRALFRQHQDFYRIQTTYILTVSSITQELQGCLIGSWPLGQIPARAICT